MRAGKTIKKVCMLLELPIKQHRLKIPEGFPNHSSWKAFFLGDLPLLHPEHPLRYRRHTAHPVRRLGRPARLTQALGLAPLGLRWGQRLPLGGHKESRMPLYSRIVYSSQLAPSVPAECVADIVRTARQFNAAHGITGLLVFDGQRFCQYLEGPDAPIGQHRPS